MVETAEFFRFEDDEGLEFGVNYGNPPMEEKILFHRDERISTKASVISQIFWEDPGAFKRLTESIRDLASSTLNPARASLLADATQLMELFIKAGAVFPPED